MQCTGAFSFPFAQQEPGGQRADQQPEHDGHAPDGERGEVVARAPRREFCGGSVKQGHQRRGDQQAGQQAHEPHVHRPEPARALALSEQPHSDCSELKYEHNGNAEPVLIFKPQPAAYYKPGGVKRRSYNAHRARADARAGTLLRRRFYAAQKVIGRDVEVLGHCHDALEIRHALLGFP